MKALFVFLLASLPFGWGVAVAQSFSVNPTQVEVVLAPGFNHLPVRVNVISNTPAFDAASLQVTSDADWVIPSVESGASKVVLKFATASLVAQPSTATITARQGATTNRFFVYGTMAPLNVVKVIADPIRPRAYGIHANGVNAGALVSYDPLTGSNVGSRTLGKQPTDLAVSPDGKELFVIHAVDKSIQVFDAATLDWTETIPLPEFDNWGVGSTTADIGLGPNGVIYYTDGAWAPILRVLDRSGRKVLQRLGIDTFGVGAFAVSNDRKSLVAWAQYGWSAGFAGSYLARFAVDSSGSLTFVEETSSSYPGPLSRDPLDTPVLISNDDQKCFAKQLVVRPQALSPVIYSLPSPVYSISPGGEVAMTAGAIYQTETGNKLYDLPTTTSVQAVTLDYSRLVYFDATARQLKSLNLLAAIGPGVMNRKVSPPDGAVTLAPSRFTWPPIPGTLQYRVYLGTSKTEVASAGTNSTSYLGAVNALELPLSGPWTSGATYFWRIDEVNAAGVVIGDVYQFTVSEISSSATSLALATLQGHVNLTSVIQLDSAVPGKPWEAVASVPWVSFDSPTGVTPASLTIRIDASKLPPGLTNATVSLRSGGTALFSVPLNLRVEPLRLTVLKSDPNSKYLYGISEDTTAAVPSAYLLEINSESETIERVLPVGSSATDLAIHNGDGRVYVTNWRQGQLLSVDRSSFKLARSYAVAPFAGVGYSTSDVFKVTAATAGRLIVEGMDQWIAVSIFSTGSGSNLASINLREGGGACSPDGRYYYHGDDNISDAEIHRFDLTGDKLTALQHLRVASVGYYGSRVVVVSEDGQRVFWNGSALRPDLSEEWTIADIIYSCSRDGRYAFGQDKIYDVVLRQPVLGMPASTGVSAFNTLTHKLVAPVAGAIRFYTVDDPPTLPRPVLGVASATPNAVVVTWTDNSLETSFTLQTRLKGNTVWTDLGSVPQNTNRFNVTGLVSGSIYDFRVKANAARVSSDWSDVVTATTPNPPPSVPALGFPVVTASSVLLGWSDSVGEDFYVLEKRSIPDGVFSSLTNLPAGAIKYLDSSVVRGGVYEYRIKAVNVDGSSEYSVVRLVTVPPPSPPQVPAFLNARAVTGGLVEVSWSEVLDSVGYLLQRRTDDPGSWVPIANLPANSAAYRDTHVVAGTEYWYRVAATNRVGSSGFSAVSSVIPRDLFPLIADDFNAGPNPKAWAEILGGVAVDGGKGFLGSRALWFGTNTDRSATTIPLPVSAGTRLDFKLRAGNQDVDGGAYWNNSETGESVVLECSTDGFVWNNVRTFDTTAPDLLGWRSYSVVAPDFAQSPRTQFRWRQLKNSGAGYDTWAIDDLAVLATVRPTLLPPGLLLANLSPSSGVTVMWSPSVGALYYVVERRPDGQSWTLLSITSDAQTFFLDTAVLPQKGYSYRVKAVNGLGESDYSEAASVTTLSQWDAWSLANFGKTGIAPGDTGTDGVPYLVRYAYHLNPQEAPGVLAPGGIKGLPRFEYDGTHGRLRVELVRRSAAGNPGVTYLIQFSNDLAIWETSNHSETVTPIDATWERVTVEDLREDVSSRSRFGRVLLLDSR